MNEYIIYEWDGLVRVRPAKPGRMWGMSASRIVYAKSAYRALIAAVNQDLED